MLKTFLEKCRRTSSLTSTETCAL